MEVRFFEELNGSKAASVEPRKNDKKSRSKAYKRGMELLGWHAVSWLYEHQWLEHGWRGEGRTWWLKYQRYLRGIGLKHTRISGKEVVDINPWYEVKLANGSSKFINGCCSYESYVRNFCCGGNPTGYIDTYEDPNIVRISKKNQKAKKA